MSKQQFRPPLWSTLAAILAIALFLKLGFWQLSRAEEKESSFAQLEYYAQLPPVNIPDSLIKLDDFLYHRVDVSGYFEAERTILLDNKTYQGMAGYHVLTPLRQVNSTNYVLVNRGWVAVGNNRSVLPNIFTPEGLIKLTGTVVPPSIRTLSLSDKQYTGRVWQNFSLDSYQNQTGLTFQPFLLLQQNETPEDNLIRQWDKPDSGSSRNTGYAFQWFSLAAVTLIIYIVLNVKRKSIT
ncbi:SURF1 family protein [Nitrosomonas sp.]|uniref:SURF1 family protein n=1 Tax=Nitrosomonas sp. TaxID=42353 RepID=UPI0025D4804A|nr:SURF1 family protein [Nitrosomonas sp.]